MKHFYRQSTGNTSVTAPIKCFLSKCVFYIVWKFIESIVRVGCSALWMRVVKTGYKMKHTGQKEQDMLADDLCRVKQTVTQVKEKQGYPYIVNCGVIG